MQGNLGARESFASTQSFVITNDTSTAVYPFKDYVPFPNSIYVSSRNSQNTFNVFIGCDVQCNQAASCIGYLTNSYYNNCNLRSTFFSPVRGITNYTSYYRVQPRREYTVYSSLATTNNTLTFFTGDRNQCRQACDAIPQCVGYVL